MMLKLHLALLLATVVSSAVAQTNQTDNGDGFPNWCDTISKEAQAELENCGGTSTETDGNNVPEEARDLILECTVGAIPCIATGALAKNARGNNSPDGVCARDYQSIDYLYAYSYTSGAKYACCTDDVATISNPGSALGTCDRGSAASLGFSTVAAGLMAFAVSFLFV